jgi:hypothetical protein
MVGWARRQALAGMAFALFVAAGCGGGGTESNDGSPIEGQFVDCSKESRAKPYAPGTVERSSGGQLDVTLVENLPGAADANNAPGPWVKGSNTWRIKIDDLTGAPVAGLGIQTVPRMPDHGHGTSITPLTTDEGGGDYVISPLYLYMGGYWQVTLNIRPAAADGGASSGLAPDSVVFDVCIPG